MEATDDHVLETVALDFRPILDLVGGDILGIAGHIVRSEGIRSLSTNRRHEFVVLIRDEVLGSHLTHRVDLVIGLFTLVWVSELTIGLIAVLDILQQGSLSLGIVRSEVGGSLEHQVLQVMS